jgi:hypothetical protein
VEGAAEGDRVDLAAVSAVVASNNNARAVVKLLDWTMTQPVSSDAYLSMSLFS